MFYSGSFHKSSEEVKKKIEGGVGGRVWVLHLWGGEWIWGWSPRVWWGRGVPGGRGGVPRVGLAPPDPPREALGDPGVPPPHPPRFGGFRGTPG